MVLVCYKTTRVFVNVQVRTGVDVCQRQILLLQGERQRLLKEA